MAPFEIGILCIGILLLLICLRVPVAFASMLAGLVGSAWLLSPDSALNYVVSDIYSQFNTYTFSAVPMFILMGYFAASSGITDKLFDVAYKWMGRLPGGLAIAAIAACAAFAAVSSSGPATAATIGKIAYPQMKRFGYDSGLATGAIAAGGTLGPVIPPSGAMVVYAILTGQSIIDCLIAGLIPGFIIAFLMIATTYYRCKRNPALGPPGPRVTMKEKVKVLPGVLETLVLFGFVIGGMYAGWFTPTQAGAAGAFGALLITAIERKFKPRMVWDSAKEAGRLACMVLFLIAGSVIFGHLLSLSTFTSTAVDAIQGLPLPSVMIIILICIFYIIGGCFIDSLGLLVLTVPIIAPIVHGLGYDLVWWGVVMCVLGELGAITPPLGVNVFVIRFIAKDVPLSTAFRGIWPYFVAICVGMGLVIAFPQLATWLPSLSH